MNRKIAMGFIVLIAVSILATPLVSAKPGEEKNNGRFDSFVMHLQGGGSTDVEGYPIISPSGKITFTKAVWTLGGYNDYIKIGDDPEIYFDDDAFTNLLVVTVLTKTPFNPYYPDGEPGYVECNYRIYEKITWGDGNFIEMNSVERFFIEQIGPNPETDWSIGGSGTFSGYGEIEGQKVQLVGIREAGLDFTVFDFVVENTGTIQFLGNAA
jgi:hypothetical protein